VREARERVNGLVRSKLAGFIGNIVDEFSRAAEKLEGKRLAMVECHRTARRDLEAVQNERQVAEARERADRFRKGLLGLWDRATGWHARLRKENEREAAACAKLQAMERQILIDRQLEERRRLQEEIKLERRRHTREMAMLHREISTYRQDGSPEELEGERRRRARRMSGPVRWQVNQNRVRCEQLATVLQTA
jgi:hypothetical protein